MRGELDYYDKNAVQFQASTIDADVSELHSEFCNLLGAGAKVLDAGCGIGRDIEEFLKRGYTVDAFDQSEAMVKMSGDRTGVAVVRSTFDTYKSDQVYDGIWCCASLLHVVQDKLPDTISGLCELLKNKGIFYSSFKYGDSERIKDGRRFTDLTEELLSRIINRVEILEEEKVWVSTDVRPGRNGRWLNAIHRKK
jgi:SAM-dependent methyltransferase